MMLLLAVVTLGLYGLFWVVVTTNELRRNGVDMISPWFLFLTLIPYLGIIFAVVYYVKFGKALHEVTGWSKGGFIAWWILFGFVAMFISQHQLNKLPK